MKAITIYFHIGDSKTGTSYIQNFLDINRQELLSRHKCLYPNFLSEDLNSGRCHNHTKWFRSSKDDEQKIREDIDNLIRYAKKNSVEKIILSCEGWLFHPQFIPFLRLFINEHHIFHAKIICYLRRIDEWVESAWKQWGLKENDNFEQYSTQPRFQNRYKHILERLDLMESVIGGENIIVRPYEKQQLENGLLSDFLKTVAVDDDPSNWKYIKEVDRFSNAGFDRDLVEILHYCRELFEDAHDNRLFGLFNNLLGEAYKKEPFKNYALFSPEQRLAILNSNLPFEKRIAEKYMGRQDSRLFFDSLPHLDEHWEPYEGLDLRKTIPVIIKMIDENNKVVMQNKKTLEQAATSPLTTSDSNPFARAKRFARSFIGKIKHLLLSKN